MGRPHYLWERTSSTFTLNSIPTPFFMACFSSLCFLLPCGLLHSFHLKAELSNVKRTPALPEGSPSRLWLKWSKRSHRCGFVLGGGWRLCKRQHPPQGSEEHGRAASLGVPAPFPGGSGPAFPSNSRGMSVFKGKNGEDPFCLTAPLCSVAAGGTNLSQL